MSLRSYQPDVPEPDGDKPAGNDGRQGERSEKELQGASLASQVLSSWGHTFRVLAIASVLLVLVIFGLWLLRVDIIVGPLSIKGR